MKKIGNYVLWRYTTSGSVAGNFCWLNFRYVTMKAYFRGLIFVVCPEHVIINCNVTKITKLKPNEKFPLYGIAVLHTCRLNCDRYFCSVILMSSTWMVWFSGRAIITGSCTKGERYPGITSKFSSMQALHSRKATHKLSWSLAGTTRWRTSSNG